jgi:purine-binding chemotaxis protein CheW
LRDNRQESWTGLRDGGTAWMKHKEIRADGSAGGEALKQVLTFSLGSEIYGVDILRVKEIKGWSPVTPIPKSPACMLGVLNLRGEILPVIDLRARFALPAAEFTPLTVIIVLSVRTARGQRECGIVVDDVQDVVDITPDSIRPAPTLNGGGSSEFIQGIAALDQRMLVLLKADELVPREMSADMPASTAA